MMYTKTIQGDKMAKWKICRQEFGNEEFAFVEGENVPVGRGFDNKITLSSIVVSRNHCVIKVQKDNILITDLNSSNGTYIGTKKIPVKSTLSAKNGDTIGFGWNTHIGTSRDITDGDKHVFKLIKVKCNDSISSRIQYISDSEDTLDNIDKKVAALDGTTHNDSEDEESKALKRKSVDKIDSSYTKVKPEFQINNRESVQEENVINLLSDSDSEIPKKKPKKENEMAPIPEELPLQNVKEELVKTENEMTDYEAFEVKQEYLGFDDNEAIQIDSDSDSDSEHWLLRLSQSSPGKPFIRRNQSQVVPQQDNTSYSQIEDPPIEILDGNHNDEEFYDDIISIPHQQQKVDSDKENETHKSIAEPVPNQANDYETDEEEILNDIITFNLPSTSPAKPTRSEKEKGLDVVDGTSQIPSMPIPENQCETGKKAQMIEPLVQLPKRKAHAAADRIKPKKVTSKNTSLSSSSKHRKSKHSSSKTDISNSQKEERKKRLKEIATKDKDESEQSLSKPTNQSNKSKVNAKVTSTNRGTFLADVAHAVVKPMTRKVSPEKPSTSKEKKEKEKKRDTITRLLDDIDKSKKTKAKDDSEPSSNTFNQTAKIDTRIPLKSLKPLSECEETGKPTSKVDPLPPKKSKKSVRFSDAPAEVRLFEIEPGHRLNKTSSIKTTLVDTRKMPVFSLEKITLMKILRWNPHWLDEQINNNDPPPILGNSKPPLGMFEAFESHYQYVSQVGDLLLMEIWECISQGYMRVRHQNYGLSMKIISLPPAPPLDRSYDLFNITVEISLPKNELRNVPRMGEIMIVYFGPENARNSRFLFVTNVQPPNNRRPCFTVSLHATFTEKMRSLQCGEVMVGKSLAHIHKELSLFEAMEYLAGSPLSELVLRPEPRHFPEIAHHPECSLTSQWTKDLNDSQKDAVSASVSAALGDRPCIQMVQGPPGTGKSSVICAMVMAYFYSATERRLPARGKILVCATSNAAVDELVLRLLNIRQNLPKNERFRMVRVGRSEAMHPRARDVSSQTLAQRDARPRPEQLAAPALREEISRLTAKINMWKTTARDAKDPSRAVYCEERIRQLTEKRALLGGGNPGPGGDEPRPEDVARAERRIIDCADIVLTTLASAVNQKMRGLKRRIALCIVDEAGQAIEPETLIPLTLDVTRLALIGDPQQLPGYICSQRAKRHGLGESLFARLAGAAQGWARSPVVLLARQYRMHAAIADYPVRAFYGGAVASAARPRPPLPFPPYTILTVASGDKGQGAAGGNEMEAWGVTRLVAALRGVAQRWRLSLAVITPYNAHKELIKRNLRAIQDPNEQAVEVNTVDSFQGQERDIVVVSLARSHGVGFLTDAGRVNVMLTRAKHALLVALNPHAVMRNDQWRTLVEDAQRRNMLRSLPIKMCQPFAPGCPADDVMQYIQ